MNFRHNDVLVYLLTLARFFKVLLTTPKTYYIGLFGHMGIWGVGNKKEGKQLYAVLIQFPHTSVLHFFQLAFPCLIGFLTTSEDVTVNNIMCILSEHYKHFIYHLIVTKTQQGQCIFLKVKKLIFFNFIDGSILCAE